MRTLRMSMLILLVAFVAIPADQALAAGNASAMLPQRPQPLTQAQYDALKRISDQPQHAAIRQLRATYRDKNTQIASDSGQVAFLTALAGGILTVLIAAAPL